MINIKKQNTYKIILIVGAGAVVTRSFKEGYSVIAGNPAAVIKLLDKEACDKYKKTKYI